MKETTFPGDQLRTCREQCGLTVTDVFRALRIPGKYIEALELGDLAALPDLCVAVGFIKSYCQFLGLSPEPYVDSFRACMRPTTRFIYIDPKSKMIMPAWANELATWGVVCAFLLLAWFAYAIVFHPDAEQADKQVEAGNIELLVPPDPEDPEPTVR